jgi:hypothetical protein
MKKYNPFCATLQERYNQPFCSDNYPDALHATSFVAQQNIYNNNKHNTLQATLQRYVAPYNIFMYISIIIQICIYPCSV